MNQQQKIQELEKRVEKLERTIIQLQEEMISLQHLPTTTQKKLGSVKKNLKRTESRQITMSILERENPNYIAMKASREDGGGIILKHRGLRMDITKTIKFYHALSQYEDKFSGVFKVPFTILDNNPRFNYYIFNVLWRRQLYTFVFGEYQMRDLLRQKEPDKKGDIHLNFEMRGNDFIETRGLKTKRNAIKITRNHNAWKIEERDNLY